MLVLFKYDVNIRIMGSWVYVCFNLCVFLEYLCVFFGEGKRIEN